MASMRITSSPPLPNELLLPEHPMQLANFFKTEGGAYTDLRELTHFRYAATQIVLLPMRKAMNPLSGMLTSRFKGRGTDFAEVRIYQPGDDVRTIDWRVTARTRKPHTKLFQEEKERPVLIMVDQSASMFFGSRLAFKSVTAAQAAALIAWTALEAGDRVGGIVFSDVAYQEIRPRRSKHAVLRLLHEINEANHKLSKDFSPSSAPYLAEAVQKIRRVSKHGTSIFLISDFIRLDEQARIHLKQLSHHNDIVALHISDAMERRLPKPDLYTITDGVERTRINTISRHNREGYESAFEQRLSEVRAEFSRIRAPFFELQTHESVVERLGNLYSQFSQQQRSDQLGRVKLGRDKPGKNG